jgi:O-antigen/teichoic acid export membrane protein
MMLVTRLRRLRGGEFGGLATDSFHVAIWQGAVSVADLVQMALITHVLGLNELGRLALALSFVVLVGQFFDVRVGAALTTFGARRLAAQDAEGLAGVFQFSYLIDVVTGVAAFGIVAVASPFVGPHLVGPSGTLLILLYALTLLISTADESSIGVLRLLDRFPLIAGYTLGLESLRVGMVAGALAISPSLTAVLLALVAYDLLQAVTNLVAATHVFRVVEDRSLWRSSLSAFQERRQMLRMVFHTNLVSYARITQVQLPTLLLGALSTLTQVGLYKVGTAAGAIVGRLADPAYAAVLPRFSRLWAANRRGDLRRLVQRATLVSCTAMALALLIVIVLRDPILRLLGGSGGAGAVWVLVLSGVGYAVNGALFWNVGVLYAAGRSGVVAVVALVVVGLQTALLAALAPFYGANGAAVALLVGMVASNALATLLSLRVLSDKTDPVPEPSAERAHVPLAGPSADG